MNGSESSKKQTELRRNGVRCNARRINELRIQFDKCIRMFTQSQFNLIFSFPFGNYKRMLESVWEAQAEQEDCRICGCRSTKECNVRPMNKSS